jgi:hypothetical protein
MKNKSMPAQAAAATRKIFIKKPPGQEIAITFDDLFYRNKNVP